MPFLTETIWESVPKSNYKKSDILMIEKWPN